MAKMRSLYTLCAILAAALTVGSIVHASVDRGIIYLGYYTFKRVVDGSRNVLVRFDKEHFWGTGFDHAFEELAKTVAASEGCDLFVATVSVGKQEHEKDNAKLAKRYSIGDGDYPSLKLFKKGVLSTGQPVSYPAGSTAGSSAEDLMAWITAETGVFCGPKGQLKGFHPLAYKLRGGADPAQLLSEAQALIKGITGADKEHAEYYLWVFEKAVEDRKWPTREAAQLQKLIEPLLRKLPPQGTRVSSTASTAADIASRDAMQVKLNILASFTPLKAEVDDKEL